MRFTETKSTFLHFLTSVCAIVGGVFTVSVRTPPPRERGVGLRASAQQPAGLSAAYVQESIL